jgi:hypothetical protein
MLFAWPIGYAPDRRLASVVQSPNYVEQKQTSGAMRQ